jgi:eukaryotic-like serine/threonine-protein kinase
LAITHFEMAGDPHCQRCGVALAGQAVGELCAHCLLKLALDPPDQADESTSPMSATSGEFKRVRYFGDYELIEEIARGGMGVVYRARQVSLNRTVALKMILAGNFSSSAMVQRFQTEAEAAARLEHPNIVPIYEIGVHEGQHYFSMRFLEGGTLTQAMAREKFGPRRAAELVRTVARAVHYAHQHGILHRDLKPGNILFDQVGQPYVADFGLAKLLEQDSALTQSVAILGTPSYMAPEQAAGQTKQLSTAADVYSLGAVLYELLTGRAPFRGPTPAETMRQVTELEPERPRLRNPVVDRDLEIVCLKCLEKDPRRRYGSAEGLAEDLQRWLSNQPVTAVGPSAGYMFRKFARRNQAMLGMSAVLVMILFVATFVSAWQAIRATRSERLANQRVIELAAERDVKETAREGAEAISMFLTQIFQSPEPTQDGHTITVAQTLDRAAQRIETDLAGQPERKVRL